MENKKTQPNDSAFAKSAFYHVDGGIDHPSEGLSKREYFAAMAMQGILSNSCDWSNYESHLKWISQSATQYADALIEALNTK